MFLSFDDLFEKAKELPYKEETLAKYKKKWEDGESIPFGIKGTLKAIGEIPRSDGSYKVSKEYETPYRISKTEQKNSSKPKRSKKEKGFIEKYVAPKTKRPDTHAERVEKRIHREEKKKLKNAEHPERILKHPDFKHKGNPVDKDFEGNMKKLKPGKKQEMIPTKKVNKKSFGGNDVDKKTYDAKPGAKKKWSSDTKISENLLSFEEFSLYESLTYSGGDVARMPIIGRVTTKPIGPFKSETYDIVEIVEDEKGNKYYICNFWHKRRVPQIIHEDLVEKFEPMTANEKLKLKELEDLYPEAIITMDPHKFPGSYFARVDIMKQDGEKEYLGALKGPVSEKDALSFFETILSKKYNKFLLK